MINFPLEKMTSGLQISVESIKKSGKPMMIEFRIREGVSFV